MHRKVNFLTLSVLLTINAGCILDRQNSATPVSALPASDAPSIHLRFASASTLSLVSHQLAPRVTFVDARLPAEKMYYPGETDSSRSRDAIAVLPLESFQPHLEKALREKVLVSLTDVVDYELIEIRLNSFHVALDERLPQTTEHKRDSSASESATVSDDMASTDGVRNAAVRVLDRMTDPMVEAVTPVRHQILKVAGRDPESEAASLPPLLTSNKQSGWNCVLQADVVMIDRNGEQRTLKSEVAVHAADQPAADANRQIQQIVASALQQFSVTLAAADQQTPKPISSVETAP